MYEERTKEGVEKERGMGGEKVVRKGVKEEGVKRTEEGRQREERRKNE